MAFEAAFITDLLELYFNATTHNNFAEDDSSSPATNYYISLHTGDPAGGNQTTNEIAYTEYARIAVARTSGGWTVSGSNCSNTDEIVFGEKTGGVGGTVTHIGLGLDVSGTGTLIGSAAASPNIDASDDGTIPRIPAGDFDVNAS